MQNLKIEFLYFSSKTKCATEKSGNKAKYCPITVLNCHFYSTNSFKYAKITHILGFNGG